VPGTLKFIWITDVIKSEKKYLAKLAKPIDCSFTKVTQWMIPPVSRANVTDGYMADSHRDGLTLLLVKSCLLTKFVNNKYLQPREKYYCFRITAFYIPLSILYT
jgi:hypothetical protein